VLTVVMHAGYIYQQKSRSVRQRLAQGGEESRHARERESTRERAEGKCFTRIVMQTPRADPNARAQCNATPGSTQNPIS
jgi:hypothetical protein